MKRTRVILMQVGSSPSVRITRAEFRALAAINRFSPESKATQTAMLMCNDGLTVGDTTYYYGFAQPDVRDAKTGRFSREVVSPRFPDAYQSCEFDSVIPPAVTPMTWQTLAIAFLLAVLIPCCLIPALLNPVASLQYVAVSGFAVMGLVIPARYQGRHHVTES